MGTTSPAYTLDVAGSAQVTGTLNTNAILVQGISTNANPNLLLRTNSGDGFWDIVALDGSTGGDGSITVFDVINGKTPFRIQPNAPTNTLYVRNTGNVGIGTASPTYKLDVAGLGHFTGLVDAPNFVATTTTATSTFAGGFSAGNNAAFVVNRAATANSLYINPSGNVGIGTTNPGYKLEVNGSASSTLLYQPNTSDANTGVIYKGATRFIHNFTLAGTDGQNTFVGLNAGNFTMTGSTNSQGSYNTGVGYQSLQANTTGYYNTAQGVSSLQSNTTGSANASGGFSALYANLTGAQNTAFGAFSLRLNTAGSNNTAIGEEALYATTGSNNVALGYLAGNLISSGANNIVLGASAYPGTNDNLTTGSSNIKIGYNISFPSATGSNQLNIGNIIFGTGLTGTGTTIAGNIGIGTTTPAQPLQVVGPMRISRIGTPTTFTDISNEGGVTNFDSVSGAFYFLRGGTLNYSTGVEMYISPAGAGGVSVGTNNTDANAKLVMQSQSGFSPLIAFKQQSDGTTKAYMGMSDSADSSGSGGIVGAVQGDLMFRTTSKNILFSNDSGATANLYIKNGGNIGIGTTAPLGKLHVITTDDTSASGTAWGAQNFVVGQSGNTGGVGIS